MGWLVFLNGRKNMKKRVIFGGGFEVDFEGSLRDCISFVRGFLIDIVGRVDIYVGDYCEVSMSSALFNINNKKR